MNPEELRKKYGNATIMGVDKAIADLLPAKGIVTRLSNPQVLDGIDLLKENLKPNLRCEAELDMSFKQIIPYGLLRHSITGEVFTTTRLGRDSRLKGMCSIGLGGHMDEGESFVSCLLRELKEEVGFTESDIDALYLYGYLYSDASEVDSVHLGILYLIDTHTESLHCLESDKLSGTWFSLQQFATLRSAGLLDSWSEMLFDSIIGNRRGDVQ